MNKSFHFVNTVKDLEGKAIVTVVRRSKKRQEICGQESGHACVKYLYGVCAGSWCAHVAHVECACAVAMNMCVHNVCVHVGCAHA